MLQKGDNVLITYIDRNKTMVATFIESESENDLFYFRDIHGVFAVSEKAVKTGKITFETIEE